MRFHLDDDSLTVVFEGIEQAWALKRTLVIPKSTIARADWLEGELLSRQELGWRVGGTGWPGILYAGRFTGSEGRNFVYLQHPHVESDGVHLHHVLTFELRDSPYRRLIFTVDRPDVAEGVISWWSGTI